MNQEVILRGAFRGMLGVPVMNLGPLTVATEVGPQVAAIAVAKYVEQEGLGLRGKPLLLARHKQDRTW